jgi:puromycin-sensitive aminopeptidase
LDAFRFEGTETVTFEVLESSRQVVLHAVELEIHEASVRTPGGETLPGEVLLDEARQRMTVRLASELPPGEGYQLQVRFTGAHNDQLHGFYRSAYTDAEGAEHLIVSTQFEPADAHRAFPCWDEPEFKATFVMSVIIPEGLAALSNGEVTAQEPLGDGRVKVSFAETMVMSTYLVALVVGPFELVTHDEVDGTPVRIASVPGQSHLTGFGAKTATHAVRFLSQYFGIPYPADKLDHVAIPNFAFGAMENLGCVTYRENALLVNEDVASVAELQRVAEVVAHETAHMWFGDLVTMKWWNGVWLNEAFATFMELLTTDHFRPDWSIWATFGQSKAAALVTDGLRHTRSIEFPVATPDEADAMFDILTYEKGAAVLRMLEQYLGPDTFRKGIVHYLTVHHHANTETGDLWDALEAVSGEPMRAVMDTWIFQGGYPLISVELGDDPSTITLRQDRFLYNRAAASAEQANQRWHVPINLRAAAGGSIQRLHLLLDGESTTVHFDGPIDWVVVNDGAWGFYRVRYTGDLLGRVLAAGVSEVCDPLERMSLVIDTWASVVAGSAELSEWVQVVESLGIEKDAEIWTAVRSVLERLDLVADDADRAALQAFAQRIGAPTWAELGWRPQPEESDRVGTARGRLLTLLGGVGADPQVRAEAKSRFDAFLAGQGDLDADLLTPIAHVVVAAGGVEEWETILARYRALDATPQDKVRYLMALSAASDPDLLVRTLDLALSDEVRSQDAVFLVAEVLSNPAGGARAWAWVEQHWDQLQSSVPGSLFARLVEGVPSLIEPAVAERVHAFVADHPVPAAGARLDQVLEQLDINVLLAARLRGAMAAVLS